MTHRKAWCPENTTRFPLREREVFQPGELENKKKKESLFRANERGDLPCEYGTKKAAWPGEGNKRKRRRNPLSPRKTRKKKKRIGVMSFCTGEALASNKVVVEGKKKDAGGKAARKRKRVSPARPGMKKGKHL